MTTPAPDSWAGLCGGLPDHATEIVTAHEGRPTIETQNVTHGAGVPAVDNGPTPGTVVG